jgi:hypothetical protein
LKLSRSGEIGDSEGSLTAAARFFSVLGVGPRAGLVVVDLEGVTGRGIGAGVAVSGF